MKEAYRTCKNLYIKYKEVINYLFFGVLSFIVSMVSYYLCRLCFDYLVSNLISWIIAVVFAYVTNKLFVFESKVETKAKLVKEFTLFVGGRIFTLVLETLILCVMVDMMKINDMMVKVIAQAIVIFKKQKSNKRSKGRETL